MEQQLTLWDFIPECEDGRKGSSHLLFNKDAVAWHRFGRRPQPEAIQTDIFEFLDLSVGELYSMSNLCYTTEEEDQIFAKYLKPFLYDKKLRGRAMHEILFLCRKNEWGYPSFLADEFNGVRYVLNGYKKDSKYHQESEYLKGLNKMFERRSRRYGKR